ncbi:MAG: YqgE/AlgH family protein [Kiritimatiellae bacterium]|nr:YqgE/AlgH family protein [Kiritimatiellia bacterium]MCO5069406.1 YqgE/AlgH family protein [Kiritimatiellia bacterium]
MATGKRKTLRGKLLVAHPTLLDPNFLQSIVYVAEHDAHGAVGIVLNRPTNACASELIAKGEPRHSFYDSVPLLLGGPVGQERVALVLYERYGRSGKIRVTFGLPPAELALKVNQKSARVYAYYGHAGWGADQLDSEVRDGSWLIRPADAAILNYRVVEGMWPFLINGDQQWRVLLDYLPRESRNN